MPLYEYKCELCHHQVEILQKLHESPIKKCPSCHNDSLRKLISAAAFKLKGTGWYETDFKDKKATTKRPTDSNTKKDMPKQETTKAAGTQTDNASST